MSHSAPGASFRSTLPTQLTLEVSASAQPGAATTAQPPAPQPPPAEPGTPSLAPTQAPTGFQLPGSDAIIPMTRDQVNALRSRGEVLSDQLISAQSRRDDVARELRNTNQPADRAGLEERLRFLDERILTLEQDINANSAARASLEANYPAQSTDDGRDNGGSNTISIDPFGGIIAFMVLFPISLAVARGIWRRTTRRAAQVATPQTEARFAQLEQAIDTVAVEIERVAEGQRYVTRLLSEGQPIPDFASGRASEPVPVRASAEDAR